MDSFKRILMLTPSWQAPRGNSTTARRLVAGYQSLGAEVILISQEEPNWRQAWRDAWPPGDATVRGHLLHGQSLGALLQEGLVQPVEAGRLLLTMTGTDLAALRQHPVAPWTVWLPRVGGVTVFAREHQLFLEQQFPSLAHRLHWVAQGVMIPPAAELQALAPAYRLETDSVLLPAGWRPVKDLALALDAFAHIQSRQGRGRLVIIGPVLDADYGNRLRRQAAGLSNVTLLSPVSFAQMFLLYRQAQGVINTSRHEGQPQAVMEAMTQGVPALLRRVPGNLGIIEDGGEGYYFADAAELASRVEALLEDEPRRQAMGVRAQQRALARWSPEQEMAAYRRIWGAIS